MRSLCFVWVCFLACGRSLPADEAAAGLLEAPAPATRPAVQTCEGYPPPQLAPVVSEACEPEWRTIDEARRAILGTWRGTLESTSAPGKLLPATVSFFADGSLVSDARTSQSGSPIWRDGSRFEVDALTNVCDGRALLFEKDESMKLGTFWYLRPCGRRLFFAYSGTAGLRIIYTFRLER